MLKWKVLDPESRHQRQVQPVLWFWYPLDFRITLWMTWSKAKTLTLSIRLSICWCRWWTTYYWCRPIDAGHIDADHIDAGHYSCPWSTFDASHFWCPSLLRPRKHFWCQSLLMPVTFDVSHYWCPLLLMPLVTIDANHYWCPSFQIEILPISPNLT